MHTLMWTLKQKIWQTENIQRDHLEETAIFAVVVTFTLNPGKHDAFMPLMLENAATSLRDEPGCHQFDVATDPSRPNEVFLYELYTDGAAFSEHLAASHFKSFDERTRDMILSKDVRTYEKVRQ